MNIPLKDKGYTVLQLGLWFAEVEDLEVFLPTNLQGIALILAGLGALLVLIALWQLGVRIRIYPSPGRKSQLLTSGAFAFARHPIYSGLILITFGLSAWWDSGYKLLVSLVLLIFFYFKTGYEETLLTARFPEYSEYKERSGRFFPKFNWSI